MPATATKLHWPTVAIVGVGLIGGSVGLALRSRQLAARVIGVGRSTASLAEAKRLGAVTETTTDLAGAAAEADMVVVATGVASIPGLLDATDAAVRPGTLLTDAGSTKATIVAAWEKRRRTRRGRFVAAHPIAGSHRRGP
ncbi:MAG: prephenate dehydrogenase/arogenate dehydrogenase family protein, partial [Planctomycetia bacterium]